MIPFEDLNHHQICALTDADIRRYAKIKAIEDGIRLVEEPPVRGWEKPNPNMVSYVITYSEQGSSYKQSMDLAFQSHEDALAVANILSSIPMVGRLDYNSYGVGTPGAAHVFKPVGGFLVASEHTFSQSHYDSVKNRIQEIASEIQDYEKAKKEYAEFIEQIEEIEGPLFQKLNEHVHAEQNAENSMKIFKDVYDLSGSVEKSKAYMEKMYQLSPLVWSLLEQKIQLYLGPKQEFVESLA